jgi:hypothetical protein
MPPSVALYVPEMQSVGVVVISPQYFPARHGKQKLKAVANAVLRNVPIGQFFGVILCSVQYFPDGQSEHPTAFTPPVPVR